jgi:hypothetical protein
MMSSKIGGHAPKLGATPLLRGLSISGTESRLMTRVPPLDSQLNSESENDVIENWGPRPF